MDRTEISGRFALYGDLNVCIRSFQTRARPRVPTSSTVAVTSRPIVIDFQFGIALPPQVISVHRLIFSEIDSVSFQAVKRKQLYGSICASEPRLVGSTHDCTSWREYSNPVRSTPDLSGTRKLEISRRYSGQTGFCGMILMNNSVFRYYKDLIWADFK